jgi:DNA-binding SARP family transcriptional activator/tetratricopeptide (TPR) repeat protein
VDFRLLGPVEVELAGRRVPVTRRQERCVLAILLLEAGRPVAADRLAELTWAGDPPPAARDVVATYTSRLRSTLKNAGGAESGVRLRRRDQGYVIDVDPQSVDVHRFERLLDRAQAIEVPRQRAGVLREALALWRGPALADIGPDVVRERLGARLEERRRIALDLRISADLADGRHADLIGELSELSARSPLDERLAGHLMLALYRADRQCDALQVYRTVYQRLRDLGLEPGGDLRRLHGAILRGDDALHPPGGTGAAGTTAAGAVDAAGAAGRGGRARPAPSTLPRDIPDFTGRAEIIASLLRLAPEGRPRRDTAPVIVALDGMAGVGKTTLALHLAHRLAGRYPDARLYLDLHGHSARLPLDPARAVDALLRQVGVAGDRIPEPLEERVALWRSEMSGRRALLVLDNAASSDQVGPLLPGEPGCLTLITSRRRLVGLDGVHATSLDVLTPDESVGLLARVVGNRVTVDPGAAREVATLCGNLALALRLAAARLVHRPRWQVSDLAALLRQSSPLRIDFATGGRTVASAFALSYEHLSSPAQRVFGLLGLHSGPDLGLRAAASLADLPVPVARTLLDELVDSHLLQELTAGRYRMHDLIREYASDLAGSTLPAADRDAAMCRLVAFYLHTSFRAIAFFESTAPRLHPETAPAPVATPTFAAPDRAQEWLEAEYGNLLSLVRFAARRGWHRATCQLTRAAWRHQYRRGYNDDCLETHDLAMVAAHGLGDDRAIAQVYNYRASAYWRVGRLTAALEDLSEAAAHSRAGGDRSSEAIALQNSCRVLKRLGRFAASEAAARGAAEVFRQLGDRLNTSISLTEAAEIDILMRRYRQGVQAWRAHLRLARATGNTMHRSMALMNLGGIELRRGRPRTAARMITRALSLRSQPSPPMVAEAMNNLGSAHRELGEIERATGLHREAVDIMRDFGDKAGESEVLIAYAATLRAAGDEAAAADRYLHALELAEQVSARYEEACALRGLAALLAGTDPVTARRYRRRARDLFAELGLPDGAELADPEPSPAGPVSPQARPVPAG